MILFKKVERPSIPGDKDSAKKTYPTITYKYSHPATLKEFAKEISATSGVSEGDVYSVLKDFRKLLNKTLIGGRSVNIEGLGFFYLSALSKGTEKSPDFTAADIHGLRVCFRANNDIRLHTGTSTRTDGLVLKDVDRINNPGSGSGEGEGGDGGGDIVDPMG